MQDSPILLGAGGTQAGTLRSEYTVSEYWDLRTDDTGAGAVRAYLVTLRQRLTLANPNAVAVSALRRVDEYAPYPVLAVNAVRVADDSDTGMRVRLEDYSPKTLNSAITTSSNRGTDTTDSGTVARTSGSSSATTNSFEVSESAGFSGPEPTGSVTATAGYSSTSTTERSVTRDRGHSVAAQSGSSSSMSVKDWAAYGFTDAARRDPTWAWGQEYPWNVIDFRGSGDDATITLPPYVQQRLLDGGFLYPPSQLAQFGLNFVSHAAWVVLPDAQPSADDETVMFDHVLTLWSATHRRVHDDGVEVSMSPVAKDLTVETVRVNLPRLSLLPIRTEGAGNGAVVGFVPSEFLTAPGDTTTFRCKSHAGNLYVVGSGFAPASADGVLTADAITTAAPATLTVRFTVADPEIELALHLKHWKTDTGDCTLSVRVNGVELTRHVDSRHSSGGEDNITTVTLRSRDFTVADYYDYLIMGTNVVTITVTPADGSPSCGYALRALAVQ